jgi:8-oxo-dGTP diphosphatase
MHIILVSAAALVDSGGRVLVQQRPPGGSMAGLWEFPGGKIEAGETPQTALVRELQEELGIALDSQALSPVGFASEALPGSQSSRHLIMLLFQCRTWAGTPAALHANALEWVTLAEMRRMQMPRADYPLIDQLERFGLL